MDATHHYDRSIMTFISYAQNLEDVMLWRALKHIKVGFYIDIGAAWHDEHSVTKAFYDSGWCGINVEPNPKFYSELLKYRPRDINLGIAIGAKTDKLLLNIFEDTGLSTLDGEIANAHRAAGRTAKTHEVSVKSLLDVCIEFVDRDQSIHFLKIDVEGYEELVLAGNDWNVYRPWIVVVEATTPMSQDEQHERWEEILFNAHYQFAYADGLNRFYVASEHSHLKEALRYPPNVFDSFKSITQHAAEVSAHEASLNVTRIAKAKQEIEARSELAEKEANDATVRASQAELKVRQLMNENALALEQIQALLSSSSWKITAPLRRISELYRLINIRTAKEIVKNFARHLALYVNRRPKLRRCALWILSKLPHLKARLVRIVSQPPSKSSSHRNSAAHSSRLSPHANQIYNALKKRLEK